MGPTALRRVEGPLTFMWPGLGCARRWNGHFGGQPIHIPKVSQNSLEFDPPAFCRNRAQGRSGLPAHPPAEVSPATVGSWHAWPQSSGAREGGTGKGDILSRDPLWAALAGASVPSHASVAEGLAAWSRRTGGRCSTSSRSSSCSPPEVCQDLEHRTAG